MPGSRVRVPPLLLTYQPLEPSRSSGFSYVALSVAFMGEPGKVNMQLGELIRRVDELIDLGKAALAQAVDPGHGLPSVPSDLYSEFKAASLSFLDRIFTENSAYPTQFRIEVKDSLLQTVRQGVGILKAARGEMAGGWMVTTRGLISSEVFADFLEMAEHLLEENYKDAAAVMIGSTLEEYLRQLAATNNVDVEELNRQDRMVPRKADVINADLAKAVYGKLDQKNITAWLDLRNKAAHGRYAEYNKELVQGMLNGVREFMGRVRVS
jgi:hypothetical protein